jgi:lipopolysaccharide export system protein LptA
MKILLLSLTFLLANTGLAPCAWAEKADRTKPWNIEANTMRIDDVKQVTVIDGNVVLTKGTIVIRAERIELREDPDGRQFGTVTGTAAVPAFFRQKAEGKDEFVEGESERIEYDGHADTVKFIGKAQTRRLRGATLADEISGELIVYENLTDTFRVDGGGGKDASGRPIGRFRAMLTPKPEAAVSASKVATPAQAVPALRPSTTLGSAPK